MFWRLGHFHSPSIDTILDREGGFELEDLLEEDELLQECKAQNSKLIDLYAPTPTSLSPVTIPALETASAYVTFSLTYAAQQLLRGDSYLGE